MYSKRYVKGCTRSEGSGQGFYQKSQILDKNQIGILVCKAMSESLAKKKCLLK
jgi:hypothetical protein